MHGKFKCTVCIFTESLFVSGLERIVHFDAEFFAAFEMFNELQVVVGT